MENLNDVEFGSNQSTEEAPILVAQRYLNIFRQIHIFNKDMRTKFDDELLALAPNITEFFKRLPGGRLLVEHIENVKTERGISFVKANREDFSNGLDDTPSTPNTHSAPVPTQIAGGNLTIDASFAESLAQSMANAFKQLPSSPVSSGGAAISGDFGQAFELIAEEIRTSRASLLDVLKETRNITDSVIASQVSISRILEGILSSRQHEENDATNLNNRIIASQASITKLLEGLYTASTQKNAEISDYLNVDNKLQDFRDNISQKINEALSALAQKNTSPTIPDNLENRLSSFRNEIKSDVNQSLSEIRQLLFSYMQNNTANTNQKPAPSSNSFNSKPIVQQPHTNISDNEDIDGGSSLNDEYKKKKKKKKKKSSEGFGTSNFAEHTARAGSIGGFTPVTTSADEENDFDTDEEDSTTADDLSSFVQKENVAPIDGVIRNSEYKHEDDFSNINLNVPPLDENSENQQNDIVDDTALSTDNFSDLDTSLDNLDFDLSEDVSSPLDKGLDSSSIMQTPAPTATSLSEAENNANDIDFSDIDTIDATPQTSSSDSLGGLDSFTDEIDLPHQNSAENNVDFDDAVADLSASADNTSNRFDNALDETTEQQSDNILPDTFDAQELPLDDLADEEDHFDEKVSAKSSDTSDLDSFGSLRVGSLDDFADVEQQTSDALDETEDKISASDEDKTSDVEDDEEEDFSQIQQPEPKEQSRYSAELDKIRQALTSDNIDIASLDEPIALDDYSDDENVAEDDEPTPQTSTDDNQDWEYEYVEDDGSENASDTADSSVPNDQAKSDGEDWEWEYVDENGQAVPVSENKENDDDWEWEYVEDDGNSSGEDNENNVK